LDQQIANLTANPFSNASIVAVFIGTNDIQGGNSLAAFQTSLNNLLNTLQSQGRSAVLVIPPQWYLKTDTPN
ncbi:SGNH/GDSL hydrolase family protein, partial [Enterobacter asburiae]